MPNLPYISPELLSQYQREISSQSSRATAKRKTASLKQFLGWAHKEGYVQENLAAKLSAPPSYAVPASTPPTPQKKYSPKLILGFGILAVSVILLFLLVKKLKLPVPFRPAPASEITTVTRTPIPTPVAEKPVDTSTIIAEIKQEAIKIVQQTLEWASFEEGNLRIGGAPVSSLLLSTGDTTDGDITINPDGSGIAHFLFEGTGQNFLNAQAPNLTSGSLYYGIVANNATGYDLIRLQSGSNPITRFSVDAEGDTYASGDLNVAGDIQTAGTDRLTSSGALTNITGYTQTSGDFSITQNAGDFASISQKASALSDLLTLTLDERGKSNSIYSTLTLKRFDGASEAMALLVDDGNAQFDGQLRLGRFSTNPDSIGTGSLVFNTGDNKVYFWNGTVWTEVGAGGTTSFASITSGTNTSAAMVVGSGASLSYSGTGTINASELTCTGCVANSELANSSITFAGDTGSSVTSLGGTRTIAGGEGVDTTEAAGTVTIAGEDASTTNKGIASFDTNFFTVTTGAVTVKDDSLDFAQFQDALDLDVATDIALGALTLSTSGTGALNFASTGQVSFAGNVDAANGLDVTTANLTVGGANFTVAPGTGNITTAGTLAVNGDQITSDGDLTIDTVGNNILSPDSLNIGGATAQVYNFFATSTAGASAAMDTITDLYVQGDLEVDGTIYGTVTATSMPWSGLISPIADLTLNHTANGQYVTTFGWTATGALNPWTMNLTNNAATATTQNFVTINNAQNDSASTDVNTENLLLIQQLDTATGDSKVVDNALKIDSAAAAGITDAIEITNSAGNITNGINLVDTAGGTFATGVNFSGTFTTALDLSSGTSTTDIILDDGGSIAQTADNNIEITENTRTLNLDFGEVASRIKLESASELELESTSNTTSAIVLDATAGGIDITASGASAGEDIDITATGSSINITSTEAATDAVVISSSANASGISLRVGDNLPTAFANGNDLDFLVEDDTAFSLSASGQVRFDAGTFVDSTVNTGESSGIIHIEVDDALPDSAGGIQQALYLKHAITNTTDVNAVSHTAFKLDFLNLESDAADTTRIFYIENRDTASNGITDVGLLIANTEVTANTLTDYISITATATDTTTDAIDVSDTELFNALNVGQNFILFDGLRQFSTGTGNWTLEDTAGNDIVSANDAGAISIGSTGVGTTTITLTGTSGDITLDSGDEVVLGDTDTVIIGGHAGNVAYNVIANSGEAPEEAAISSDNDLYIGGDLEVDGNIYGTISGTIPWSSLANPTANLSLNHTATGQFTTTFGWTATGALNPWTMNLTNNAATATTQNFVTINNAQNDSLSTDVNTENLLLIQQLDTATGDSKVVDNALKIDSAAAAGITDAIEITNSAGNITNGINLIDTVGGTFATGVNLSGTFTTGVVMGGTATTAIDLSSGSSTTDIILDDGASIAQTADNNIEISENTRTLNLDFSEVASRIKLESASELELESTSNTTSAIVLDATAGGIDITASAASAGEDIDITATGSSINLTATEGVANNIVLTSTNGGIDITSTGAIAGEDIDITSSASLNLTGQEAAIDAVVLQATANNSGVLISAGDGVATSFIDGNDVELRAEDDVIVNFEAGGSRFLIDAQSPDNTTNTGEFAGVIHFAVDDAMADTPSGLNQGLYLIYRVQDTTDTNPMTHRAMSIDFQNSEADASDTTYVLSLDNLNDATGAATDALITLENNDANTAVGSGIIFLAGGANSPDFTTGISFDAADFTTEIELENAETITNQTNGSITFTGVGQTNNGSLTIDLETNSIPTLTSSTDTAIGVDEDLTFIGAQAIDTTTGNLTVGAAGTGTTANVYIGDSTATDTLDLLIVGQKLNAGNPTGVEGAVYYNASSDKFYIYEGGGSPAWKEICNKTDQACGTGTGSAWSALSAPTADLTLAHTTWNTTFNWVPTADTAETNFSMTIQGQDAVAGGEVDQVLLALSNASNSVDTDQAADSLLTLANNDLNDPVTSAIRFDAGAAGTDFTYGINFDAADFTTEIVLENAETISNQVDGTIALGGDILVTGGDITGAGANPPSIDLGETTAGAINFIAGSTTAGDFVFNVDSDSNISVTGGADGTDALNIAAGNVSLTDGDLTLLGGDFNVTLDAADTLNVTKTGADAGDVANISGTSANAIQGLTIALTSTADTLVDAYQGLNITWTESTDADTFTAINIGNTTTTNSGTTAISIGTGWDTGITVGSGGVTISAGNLAVNSDTITSDGNLTIDATTTVIIPDADTFQTNDVTSTGTLTLSSGGGLGITIDSASGAVTFATDDDLIPTLGAGDADIGASGTRWDNVFAVAGNFSGTVTVGDLACTDCLDFTEFADNLTLDVATDIALGALTLSTSGTGALNFASTGQVSFAGNVDAANGLDVTTANLTVGGANFTVAPGTGNITTAGDIAVNGDDITSDGTALTININGASAGNLVLADTDTINVGGLSGYAYSSFASGTDAKDEAAIAADNDVYIGGDLEVDGTIFGNVTANDLVCTDCVDASDLADTLDFDTATETSWTFQANNVTSQSFLTVTTDGLTSGTGTTFDLTATGVTTAFSGDLVKLNQTQTYTGGVGTQSGNVLDIARSITRDITTAGDLALSGALATISDTAATSGAGTGTLTHSADVLRIAQNYTANTGSALNVTSAGGATGFALRVNDDGTFTDTTPFVVDNSGNVGIGDPSPAALFTVGSGDLFQIASNGNLTTSNAGSWTFSNDTNFVLSGGLNGLSFNTNTLSIDATNSRVGIRTTAPLTILNVVGAMSTLLGYDSTTANGIQTFGKNPLMQLTGDGSINNGPGLALLQLNIGAADVNQSSAELYLGATRGTIANSRVAVADGDILGSIGFFGDDATNLRSRGSMIQSAVDTSLESVSTGVMPARLSLITTEQTPITFHTNAGAVVGGNIEVTANERMRIDSAGNVGVNDTSPDAKLEVLATTEQLRLTNVDGTTDARFTVSSTGDLTLDMLGSGTTDQLVLADTDTINIGGSGSTEVAYNVIGDSTTGASASMNSDDDLYIEGDLEVDGTIIGTVAGSVAWNNLSAPTGDLTLAHTTWNTTFNWVPTADTAETNFSMTIQGQDAVAGGEVDQVLLALSNASNSVDTDQAADSLLTLANNDLNDPVTSAIRFDAGAAGTDFTYGINFDAADFTTEIVLENAETIANQTDGTITLGADSGALTLSLSGTAATISNTAGNMTVNAASNLVLADATIQLTGGTTVTMDLFNAATTTLSILNSTGGVAADVTIEGDLTVTGGDITGANSETIDIGEADNGTITFTGVGETNNGVINFDLETNSIPTINTGADTALGLDEDLTFIGAQSITTTAGDLTIDSFGGSLILATDDDLIPTLGAGSADIGASLTRWDNVFAVAGDFSGTVTALDFACTDCLDFTELADSMTLDGTDGASSLSIAALNTKGITITSDLTAGARSVPVLTISQANNATFNGATLVTLSDADTGLVGAVLSVDAPGGAGNARNISLGRSNSSPFTGIALDLSGMALSTGTGIYLTPAALTTGKLINVAGGTTAPSDFSGDYILINPTFDKASAGTVTFSGNYLDITRANTVSDAGGIFAMTGDLATLSSNCTVTLGSCTDSSNILELNQQFATATGAVLNVLNAGTGNLATLDTTNASANGISLDIQSSSSSQYALSVTSNNGATTGLYVRADGNVGIGDTTPTATLTVGSGDLFQVAGASGNITTSGDLAVNGGDITTTATTLNIDVANTGTINFRDGTNALAAVKDQGDYVFWNLKGKSTTGNPATCAEGDIYYNAFDDTVYVCHAGNTWEQLDGGGTGSSLWSGLLAPDNDLTLAMAAFNSTFNWDPGPDAAETNWTITTQGEDTTGTGDQDQILLALSQTANGVNVDEAADALLTFANNDADDPVENAIRFDAGGAGTDFTYGINFDLASIGTAELVLQGGERIHNVTDGTITFEDDIGSDLVQMIDQGTTGRLAVSDSLQVGGLTTVAYSRFGTSAQDHFGGTPVSSDVLISGKLEIRGNIFLDSADGAGGGAFTIADYQGTGTIIFPADPTISDHSLTAGNWLVDNTANVGKAALIVNQAKAGDIFTASASGVAKFIIANNGNVTISGSGTMLTVGGGTGKVDVGTVDPVYNISGTKFATYMAGMIGVKEETTGNISTSQYLPGIGYRNVIDFKTEPQGSDLWLFSRATDISNNIGKMVVLLSPSDNTRTWYEVDEANYTLAIYSSRPTQISYRLTAPRFDSADWSNYNDNPESTGFQVEDAPLVGTGEENTPEAPVFSDFEIVKEVPQIAYKVYQTISEGSKIAVDEFGAFANLVAGNIKAGAIESKEIATETFYSFQGTIDNLLITGGLVSPIIETETISPLADKSDVKVKIGNEAVDSGFGKLIVENTEGQEVAAIDTEGNATFSGTLEADEVKTNEVIAGKIYADEIVARNGFFSETNTASVSGITREEIESILREVEQDQDILAQASTWNVNTATNSANLDELAVSNLYVTDQAAINVLSVTSTIALGPDLVLQSKLNEQNLIVNSIDTLSAPLSIQSLALAPVEIMAGKVKVETNGDLTISGNLFVAGRVESSGLTLKDTNGFGDLLNLEDGSGNRVAAISASGSAEFASVATEKLIIAGGDTAPKIADINQEIQTNATAGSAIIQAGITEITIRNPKISDYTLVYVTPTSSTQNNVLYVKSKAQGFFTVGFSQPLDIDVVFNWWVIDIHE